MGPESMRDSTGSIVNAVCSLLGGGQRPSLHWKRFREPVTVSLGVGMVAMAIMFLLAAVMPRDPDGDRRQDRAADRRHRWSSSMR